MKVYYLTKTWSPSKTGGSLMRQKQVEIFKNNDYDVVIVTPNYESNETIIQQNLIQLPFRFTQKYSIGQRFGIYEDYLDKWVNQSFKHLKEFVTDKDVVFATSGGELGTFKLGTLLKKHSNCKLIVNYRDPISYTLVNGLKVDDKFHISREKQEYKYIKDADMISTSSKTIQQNLMSKYADLSHKVINHYFGYMDEIDLSQFEKQKSEKLVIGYGGSFSTTQRPEILSKGYDRLKNKSGIQVTYIGNHKKYQPLMNKEDAVFAGPFEHKKFIRYMVENVDIGFVSLQNDYFGACVPSKIYEYINLGLPILAALPEGDAKSLIEDNGLGLCFKYDDFKGTAIGIKRFYEDKEFFLECQKNVLTAKPNWSMNTLFNQCIDDIKKI